MQELEASESLLKPKHGKFSNRCGLRGPGLWLQTPAFWGFEVPDLTPQTQGLRVQGLPAQGFDFSLGPEGELRGFQRLRQPRHPVKMGRGRAVVQVVLHPQNGVVLHGTERSKMMTRIMIMMVAPSNMRPPVAAPPRRAVPAVEPVRLRFRSSARGVKPAGWTLVIQGP